MGIEITSLGVAERQVRELIRTPQGNIEVYEPTVDDIAEIIDLQRDKGLGMEDGKIAFDGVDVMKTLFPLLTNIDFGDISDEELSKIIENPSIHLLIAQQYVAQVVAESNKLYAQRVKTELMNTDSTLAQMELLNTIPSIIVENAKRDGRMAELVDKVAEVSDDLEKAIEKEKENEGLREEIEEKVTEMTGAQLKVVENEQNI
ncbi:hypothetical protein CN984_12315 [Bacillus cereus]|uniref:Uncharacterized protein n=1 Tax=Bacillus cereus TaxID=1396 RepID=A0A2B9Q412_BACCE|nr:hypothetical protein [Bacillus cereus]PEA25804.1 hypothetical protein CON44_17780 [Bacillus cereus]PGO29215.1 hypothetical protein CN984_12315 [Bacillus cereus]